MLKDYLAKKGSGYYLSVVSAVCALLAMIMCAARGGDVLTDFQPTVVLMLAIGLVINVLILVKKVTPFEILPFICYFVAFAIFAGAEVDFIANIIYGVDGNSLDALLVTVLLFSLLAFIFGIISCLTKYDKEEE